MGCLSQRQRHLDVRPEAKWDYITLNDFKSTSCLTPFAYCYLWFSLFLSIAVYGVDGFTAVNLLVFDKWSSDIEPSQLVPFDVSKWIFAICIILSVINLLYEHIRAHRVMRRGSVAECYLDSLAARLESIRFGSGKGFKRFLVFAELTKSKKGAEYVALFSYFSLQSWIRVLVCSGPRQAINGLTLYSVYTAKLSIEGQDFGSSLSNFFDKIKALGVRESLILSGMVFTLVIWVFSFLSLLLAVLFFVFFLSHYIPRGEGGLSGYCERKATKRLMQIVSHKINKAIAEEEKKRRKAELKAAKKTGGDRPVSMKATLPDVGGEKLPEMPMLNRNDTMATLPQYSSRPGTPGSIELSNMDRKRPIPSRTGTMASGVSNAPSYSSRQGLLGAAAQPGYSRAESPTPSLPPIDLNNLPPARSGTLLSNSTSGPAQPANRAPSDRPEFGGNFTSSPGTYASATMPSLPPPAKSSLNGSVDYRGQTPVPLSQQGQSYRRPTFNSEYSSARGSPAPYPMERRPTQDSMRQPYDDYATARDSPSPYPLDAGHSRTRPLAMATTFRPGQALHRTHLMPHTRKISGRCRTHHDQLMTIMGPFEGTPRLIRLVIASRRTQGGRLSISTLREELVPGPCLLKEQGPAAILPAVSQTLCRGLWGLNLPGLELPWNNNLLAAHCETLRPVVHDRSTNLLLATARIPTVSPPCRRFPIQAQGLAIMTTSTGHQRQTANVQDPTMPQRLETGMATDGI